MVVRSGGPPARPQRWRALAKKLLLLLASITMTLLLLEVGCRIVGPLGHPVKLRDGIYLSVLPLVNGRPDAHGYRERDGVALPVSKDEGEVRVFVFGESSVEGMPWGPLASAPTVLHDLLVSAFPDRHVTVVNMGRSGSFTLDAYYHLLSIVRYEPDYVIFYQGNNDRFDVGGEPCWPLDAPGLHAAWRALVSHSRLLLSVRVLGPTLFGSDESPRDYAHVGEDRCPRDAAFGAWTDLLVTAAQGAGARVLVTSPVRNLDASRDRDFATRTMELTVEDALAQLPPSERRRLVCELGPGCDRAMALTITALSEVLAEQPDLPVAAALRVVLPGASVLAVPVAFAVRLVGSLDAARTREREATLAHLGDIWRGIAERRGAVFVDFNGLLRARSRFGRLAAPFIVDDVHLSVRGYVLLAHAWFDVIAGELGTRPAVLARDASLDEAVTYERALPSPSEPLARQGLALLNAHLFVMAAVALQTAGERDANPTALLAVGWLRTRLGLPSGLPAALVPGLADFDPSAAYEDRKRRDGGG